MPKEYWMHQRRNLILLTRLGLCTCESDQVGETGTALSNRSAVNEACGWGCKLHRHVGLHTNNQHSDPHVGRSDVGPRATHLLGIVVVCLRGASGNTLYWVLLLLTYAGHRGTHFTGYCCWFDVGLRATHFIFFFFTEVVLGMPQAILLIMATPSCGF
jgi:hypothetical protein